MLLYPLYPYGNKKFWNSSKGGGKGAGNHSRSVTFYFGTDKMFTKKIEQDVHRVFTLLDDLWHQVLALGCFFQLLFSFLFLSFGEGCGCQDNVL